MRWSLRAGLETAACPKSKSRGLTLEPFVDSCSDASYTGATGGKSREGLREGFGRSGKSHDGENWAALGSSNFMSTAAAVAISGPLLLLLLLLQCTCLDDSIRATFEGLVYIGAEGTEGGVFIAPGLRKKEPFLQKAPMKQTHS